MHLTPLDPSLAVLARRAQERADDELRAASRRLGVPAETLFRLRERIDEAVERAILFGEWPRADDSSRPGCLR